LKDKALAYGKLVVEEGANVPEIPKVGHKYDYNRCL